MDAAGQQATLLDFANELREAERAARAVPPLGERRPGLTVADAYAIQGYLLAERAAAGARVVGRKVGLISPVQRELLGASEPDAGVITDDMVVEEGDAIPSDQLVQPRVAATIAFLLAGELGGPGATTASVTSAVAAVLPAIEVVDSRISNWRVSLFDTIADNASAGRVVLGVRPTPLSEVDLRLVGVLLQRNGVPIESAGGATALGNPIRCLAWLANALAERGQRMHAGEVVLAGDLHRAVPARPADEFRADFALLGSVTARFSGREGAG